MNLDPILNAALKKEAIRFKETQIPMLTVSASYKEDIKGFYGYLEDETTPDVVFSRAHFSMALGTAITAWGKSVDPKKAYLVDPTNFVSEQDWAKIRLTEQIGKTIARTPFLKKIKDLIDTFGRQKLPILSSIEVPIMQLTQAQSNPILSFHIAAGNILAAQGKTVVQVITDPHVREEYLQFGHKKTMFYCVFDDQTKAEALEKAAFLKCKLDPDRIIVTGPPIDPRIIQAKRLKKAWRTGSLKICITTGGLGTNTYEIKKILSQLIPLLRKRNIDTSDGLPPIELLVYASTHADIVTITETIAKQERVSCMHLHKDTPIYNENYNEKHSSKHIRQPKLRIIYHPQIVDANELLISHAFGWADCFITKPSGDMAYDAAASGSCMLTLTEWGEWEHAVRERFESLGISRTCATNQVIDQLKALSSTSYSSQSWIEQAMNKAFNLPKIHLEGTKNILKTYTEIAAQTNSIT